MSAIVSNATTFLSHYLSYKNVVADLPQLAALGITGAATLSTPVSLSTANQQALMGAGKKLFAVVDSITDIVGDMQIYIKDSVTAANNTGVVAVPVTAGGSGYITGTAVSVTGGTGSGFAGYLICDKFGVIKNVVVTNPGNYTVAPTGFTTTGGSGGTFGPAVLGVAVANIESHSGIDAMYPFVTSAANGFDVVVATWGAITYGVANGTANVALIVVSVDDTNWLDLGQNFNEGVQFTKGVMTSPVARGWNSTDHSVRVRVTNQFSIRQLYCSMLEGISHLRGKTVLIQDQVRPDGQALPKEIHFVTGAQFENAALEVGGGGGNAGVDSVTGSGSFRRMYTWTVDSSILKSAL